jgi:hypothetical protein
MLRGWANLTSVNTHWIDLPDDITLRAKTKRARKFTGVFLRSASESLTTTLKIERGLARSLDLFLGSSGITTNLFSRKVYGT